MTDLATRAVDDAPAADVVERARAGDPAAWESIHRQFGPALRRFAASRGIPDPEDLAQDVMVAAVRDIQRFSGDWGHFRSWLFTIAYRRCADRHRRRFRTREEPIDLLGEEIDPSPGADTRLWEQAAGREAVAALGILDQREREIITLRVIGEMSSAATAEAVGLSRSNVRVIQSRALAKLRRYLENNGGHLDRRSRGIPVPAMVAAEGWRLLRRLLRLGGGPPSNQSRGADHPIGGGSLAGGSLSSITGGAIGLSNAVAATLVVGASIFVVSLAADTSLSPAPPAEVSSLMPAVEDPTAPVLGWRDGRIDDHLPDAPVLPRPDSSLPSEVALYGNVGVLEHDRFRGDGLAAMVEVAGAETPGPDAPDASLEVVTDVGTAAEEITRDAVAAVDSTLDTVVGATHDAVISVTNETEAVIAETVDAISPPVDEAATEPVETVVAAVEDGVEETRTTAETTSADLQNPTGAVEATVEQVVDPVELLLGQ